jgi:hypothetical protein
MKIHQSEIVKSLLTASVLGIALTAAPELRAEAYLKDYALIKDATWFKTYINGVGVGYAWSNTLLGHQKRAPLYCEPAKVPIQGSDYLELLDKKIASAIKMGRPFSDSTPVELILLDGLVEAYPCS